MSSTHHSGHSTTTTATDTLQTILTKPSIPFTSASDRPDKPDGIFRVVIVSTGSVASVKIPDIISALSKDPSVAVQIVATKSSLHFYSQEQVDQAVQSAQVTAEADAEEEQTTRHEVRGVKVWTDADEWSDWKQIGDPILHIELRRWADLVVVAPCSADMLAKIAGGLCDNLATSLLRALSPSTPTILCPAMNTHMYQHPLTADQLRVAEEKLGYTISGPQGAGLLACGDEGPGKMTDWREIVRLILDFKAKSERCRAA
ncbi:flavoprotein [Papiliotrema laurentii]|uniref:Flavoprotein n=1 Tax=Papiliotrema laurentii TaxID=5418 RepID=A0AAD9FP63_PAPLA|nr:flavoprotein [Papiliotrema laurentii]